MSAIDNSNQRKPDALANLKETVDDMFRQAIEVENLARDMYVQFAQMFFHVPDVSDFWQGLAYDEAKHVYTLSKTKNSLSLEQLEDTADPKLLRSITHTLSLLNRTSLEAVHTLDDAYEVAHEIEFSELNYIFKCVASKFVTNEERKKILCSKIEEHQQKLVDFTKHFGDKVWRKQIPARSTTPVASEK